MNEPLFSIDRPALILIRILIFCMNETKKHSKEKEKENGKQSIELFPSY